MAEETQPTPEPHTTLAQGLAEKGWIPDPLIRLYIRRLLRERLADEVRVEQEGGSEAFRRSLATGPIAQHTRRANEQHYEVPAAFFRHVLGRHLKYSSAYWPAGVNDLSAAEAAMLEETTARAGLEDGMDILELGCGWGSLTLWMAERYPGSRIVALSNSHGQRESIEATAQARGLENLEIRTSDINDFDTSERFDRVVSVEMFEHMRNWDLLLSRVASWLRPGGRAFVHTFCHRAFAYPYENERDDDWMARFFFTGGIMPSVDTISSFDRDLIVEEQWRVNGDHYARTARAWLENLDQRREEILPILEQCYGNGQGSVWHGRWRLFFMACEELFRFQGGQEWFVVHTRLRHRDA